MSSTAGMIVLNYVCPALGVVFANFMYLAPLKDLDTAVRNGQGLNGLNPTPWALMLGNRLGYSAYALLSNDYFLFFAVGPGFLVSFWLNLGAVKLLYSAHHQLETRKQLVKYLQESDSKMEGESGAFRSYYTGDNGNENDNYEKDNDEEETIKEEESKIVYYDNVSSDDEGENEYPTEENSEDGDHRDDKDLEAHGVDPQDSMDSFDVRQEIRDKISPLPTGRPNLMAFDQPKKSVRFSNQKLTRESSKKKSIVTFAPLSEDQPVTVDERRTSLTTSQIFARQLEEEITFKEPNGETPLEEETGESHMSRSRIFSRSRLRMGAFAQKSWRRFSMMQGGFATSFRVRRRRIAQSFINQKEKTKEWGEIVWKVTSQETPAKAPHEQLVMTVIVIWFVILAVLGLFSHHDETPLEEGGKNKIALLVIGYAMTLNKIFFFGAPLGRISTVIRTKKCDSLHFPTLVGTTLNSSLWFSYGIAPQVADPFIWGPVALGLVFSAIQFTLCAIFPRTKKSQISTKTFSITSLLVRKSQLGLDNSIMSGLHEESMTHMSVCDSSSDEEETQEYMTLHGRFSFMF